MSNYFLLLPGLQDTYFFALFQCSIM